MITAPQPITEQQRERATRVMARSRNDFMISRKLVDEQLRRGRRVEDEQDREVREIQRAS